MEGAIAKTKKELIHLKNGYFKFELTAVGNTQANKGDYTNNDFTFKFLLPPLNSMGFSDHYNQSLIKIRFAEWYNPNSEAHNEIPCAVGGVVETNSKVNLHTNIPTRNQVIIHQQGSVFTESNKIISNLQTPLHYRRGHHLLTNDAIDGIAATSITGTDEITEIGNDTTAGTPATPLAVDDGSGNTGAIISDTNKFMISKAKNGWFVDNSKTSIFDDGILCGNPFGKEVQFQVRNQFTNQPLGLCSAIATNNDITHNAANLKVELEIQLLPNP
jgi:hypothetical protein